MARRLYSFTVSQLGQGWIGFQHAGDYRVGSELWGALADAGVRLPGRPATFASLEACQAALRRLSRALADSGVDVSAVVLCLHNRAVQENPHTVENPWRFYTVGGTELRADGSPRWPGWAGPAAARVALDPGSWPSVATVPAGGAR